MLRAWRAGFGVQGSGFGVPHIEIEDAGCIHGSTALGWSSGYARGWVRLCEARVSLSEDLGVWMDEVSR